MYILIFFVHAQVGGLMVVLGGIFSVLFNWCSCSLHVDWLFVLVYGGYVFVFGSGLISGLLGVAASVPEYTICSCLYGVALVGVCWTRV